MFNNSVQRKFLALFKGLKIDSGELSVSTPALQINQTWKNSNTVFTALKINITDTSSSSNSLLVDFAGKSGIRKDGVFLASGGSSTVASLAALNGNGHGIGIDAGAISFLTNDGAGLRAGLLVSKYNVMLQNTFSLNWHATGAPSNQNGADLSIGREAANTLFQRNGTNAQRFNLYNTYTDASNYERGFLCWNTNYLQIGTEGLGTGSAKIMRFLFGSYVAAELNLNNGSTDSNHVFLKINGNITSSIIATSAALRLGVASGGLVAIGGSGTSFATGYITVTNNRVAFNRYILGSGGATATISVDPRTDTDQAACHIKLKGEDAYTGHTTNISGGNTYVSGGNGNSTRAGLANGGDVILSGGTGYGTGHNGYVKMTNLPAINPATSGALYNTDGVVAMSDGTTTPNAVQRSIRRSKLAITR